uniref:Uncharacterized protein n=1 Tax=Utricularia reniformis TaxID=192314 RepID=A0A1Y0AZJ6_9LAMI|nr:hypothetical protein AEK19_MT0312 [Utricularia reniformis]ART30587.1 hypothetical protein AEK19_MT0312 [Utricularia reniformis]
MNPLSVNELGSYDTIRDSTGHKRLISRQITDKGMVFS